MRFDHLKFDIETTQAWLKWQRSHLRKMFVIILLYPGLILLDIGLIRINKSSSTIYCSMGFIIASFIYFLMQMGMSWDDYKQEKRKLEIYEKWKTEDREEEWKRDNERERKAHEMLVEKLKYGFDENKKPESESLVGEKSSCKHQVTSIHQPDATNTQ